MKRHNILLIAILGLFLFNSCSDEYNQGNGKIIEGVPTTVELGFVPQSALNLSTRGVISEIDEYKVYDLYIFVFKKSAGQWVKDVAIPFSYDQLLDKKETGNGSSITSGKIVLKIASGEKRIYAIANYNDSPLLDINKNLFENVQTINDLKSLPARMSASTIERQQGHLLMSGAYFNGDQASEEGYVAINPNSTGKVDLTTTPKAKILLKRVDSRITFKVNSATGIQFIPKEWKVVNVPLATYVYEKNFDENNHDAVTASENDYFDSSFTNFENLLIGETGKPNNYKGGDFTFYMLENRKAPIKTITDYQDRERQEKLDIAGESFYKQNGNFIYADPFATYVVMTGTFIREGENGVEPQSASVTYTVHLGYVDNVASDFKSERNCNYTYNMTINGVDNIKLEVTSEGKQEVQPGAEGHIVEAQTQMYVDAHYDVKSITFSKDYISGNASFRVKTPYDENGIYDINDPVSQFTAKDYRWVQFVRNDKSKSGGKYIYKTEFEAYPGDNHVLTIKEVIDNLKAEAVKNGSIGGENDFFDKNGNVTYTVFIDEYYYYSDPATENPVSWKEFVNMPNREMNILCNTKYSPDKGSSLTTSSLLISQRSIKTFYNTSDANLATAWGIETENETGFARTSKNNSEGVSRLSSTNGRYNTLSNIEALGRNWSSDWSTYVNVITNEPTKTLNSNRYVDLQKACLQRNRDLNGDKKITVNEIRWYLPAINQMTGIWMGKDGLPSETHLVKNGTIVTNNNKANYHFMNSNGIMFWAEEGSSTGSNGGSEFEFRCVRNLGGFDSNTPSIDNEPQDYVNYNNYIFTLTYMNDRSLRSDGEFINRGEQLVLNELQSANRPYKKFQIASQLVNGKGSWRQTVNSNISPCASYTESDSQTNWRMPNQREISLIKAYAVNIGLGGASYLWSRTSSSLSFKGGFGYGITEKIVTLPEDNASGNVRCVRDIK